jgi:hypothetical protein
MDTKVLPELVMKRKVCKSCGKGTFEFEFEFDPDLELIQKYVCTECST